MIISDLEEEHRFNRPAEVADEVAFVKTENDNLWNNASIVNGFPQLRGKIGTIVAVEFPKKDNLRVKQMMEDAGADDIIQN